MVGPPHEERHHQQESHQQYGAHDQHRMGAVQSDIIGTAADEYNRIANEELQAYFLDLQDLDTTMGNITRRVNEAIQSYE